MRIKPGYLRPKGIDIKEGTIVCHIDQNNDTPGRLAEIGRRWKDPIADLLIPTFAGLQQTLTLRDAMTSTSVN